MTSIESTFLEAVKRGPVLILDNMRDKTHAGTFDPIVERSPLIRLAILAVDLGAEPGMLSFNYSRPENVARPDYQRCFYAVLYALQPDGAEMARMLKLNLPTLGFHWCELNSMWFVDEFAAYGRRMKSSRPSADNPNVRESLVALEPMAASVDLANPKHVRVLELVKEHFEAQGWVTAAERLAKCMEPQPAVESAAPVAASGPAPASTLTFADKAGRVVMLRGRSMPFRDEPADLPVAGDVHMRGYWDSRAMTGDDKPLIGGFEHPELRGSMTQMTADALYRLCRAAMPLTMTFGTQTRHGVIYSFQTDMHPNRTEWNLTFRAAEATAVAPAARHLPGPGPALTDTSDAERQRTDVLRVRPAHYTLKGDGSLVKETPPTPEAPKPETNIPERSSPRFQADIDALHRYLVDQHGSQNLDGTYKVDEAARIGLPDESGPAAALRLLKLAASRGTFRPPTDHSDFERQYGCTWEAWQGRQAHALRDLEILVEEMVCDKTLDLSPYPKVETAYEAAVRLLKLAVERSAFKPQAALSGSTPTNSAASVTTRMDLRDTNPDAIVAAFNKAIGPKPGSTLTEATITWTKLAVLNNDHVELQRIRDLVYERQLRLQVESDDPVSTLDVIRGLIDDAMVPATDARDMEALRTRLEAAERQAIAEAAHAEQSSVSLRKALAERDATMEKVRVLEAHIAEREVLTPG